MVLVHLVERTAYGQVGIKLTPDGLRNHTEVIAITLRYLKCLRFAPNETRSRIRHEQKVRQCSAVHTGVLTQSPLGPASASHRVAVSRSYCRCRAMAEPVHQAREPVSACVLQERTIGLPCSAAVVLMLSLAYVVRLYSPSVQHCVCVSGDRGPELPVQAEVL